jgi:type I restriction enzyme S subunit
MERIIEYAEYIDSEIEWIGKIPSHWNIGGLTKYIASIVDYRGKTPEKVESGIFLVTAKNIKNGKIDYTTSQEFVKETDYFEVMRRGLPSIGDVLFTTEAPLGEVANVDRTNIALAQRVIKFSGIEGVLDNYYLKYWMLSHGFQSNLNSFATGSTASGIKSSKLSKLLLLLPPVTEQRKIVDFLNDKTSNIDSLIADKEKLIELLQEKCQATITEVVTKGLNSNVKMRDSGVELLGDIPDNWEIKRLNYIGTLQNGISKSADEFGFGYPFVSYGDVYKNIELPGTVKGLINSSPSDRSKYSVREGDVFFTRTSETIEEIGIASTCLKTIKDATFAGFLIRFRPNSKRLSTNFAKYYFRSDLGRKYFVKEMNLVTRASLSQDLLKKFPVALPPLDEQNQIATYLDSLTEAIKDTITLLNKQIESLKEYRQALIYEAVTGKIDVRDYNKVLS